MSDRSERSIVSSAVISLVVEAIGRRSDAARWNSTSPVEASITIADGALTSGGGFSSCCAAAGAASISAASSAASAARIMG